MDVIGKTTKDKIAFLLYVFVGMTIYAIGVTCFIVPNNIVPGGFTALATIINKFTGAPIGLTIMLINLPVILLASKMLSRGFVIKTIIGVMMNSFTMDIVGFIVSKFDLKYIGDPILAALFGGVIMGIGSGIPALKGSTSGGATALGAILQVKQPQFEIGNMTMIVNFVIVAISIFAYRDINAALYALLCIFAYTKVIDTLLIGVKSNMLVFIIASDSKELKEIIQSKMGLGMTILDGHGGFTKEEKEVLMCVVEKSKYYQLKDYIKDVDKAAFMFTAETGDVVGSDFETDAL